MKIFALLFSLFIFSCSPKAQDIAITMNDYIEVHVESIDLRMSLATMTFSAAQGKN